MGGGVGVGGAGTGGVGAGGVGVGGVVGGGAGVGATAVGVAGVRLLVIAPPPQPVITSTKAIHARFFILVPQGVTKIALLACGKSNLTTFYTPRILWLRSNALDCNRILRTTKVLNLNPTYYKDVATFCLHISGNSSVQSINRVLSTCQCVDDAKFSFLYFLLPHIFFHNPLNLSY